jgi:hypothetical protein
MYLMQYGMMSFKMSCYVLGAGSTSAHEQSAVLWAYISAMAEGKVLIGISGSFAKLS